MDGSHITVLLVSVAVTLVGRILFDWLKNGRNGKKAPVKNNPSGSHNPGLTADRVKGIVTDNTVSKDMGRVIIQKLDGMNNILIEIKTILDR